MPIIKKLILGSIILALWGCANNTTVRQISDWHTQKKEIKSITIIPDDIKVVTIAFGGDGDSIPKQEEKIKSFINSNLPKMLEKKGFKASIIDSALLENPDIAFAIEEVDNSYGSIASETYQSAFMNKEKALAMDRNIGEVAAIIGAITESDAILLVDFSGFKKSTGMLVKDALVQALLGGNSVVSEGLTGNFALIDSKDGDLLWTNQLSLQFLDAKRVSEGILSGLNMEDPAKKKK